MGRRRLKISTVSQDGFHIVARYVNEYQTTIPGVRDISLELYDSQSVAFPFLQLDLQTDAWGYAEKTLTAEELFSEEPFYGTIVAKIVGDTSTVTDTGDSSGSYDHGGTNSIMPRLLLKPYLAHTIWIRKYSPPRKY